MCKLFHYLRLGFLLFQPDTSCSGSFSANIFCRMQKVYRASQLELIHFCPKVPLKQSTHIFTDKLFCILHSLLQLFNDFIIGLHGPSINDLLLMLIYQLTILYGRWHLLSVSSPACSASISSWRLAFCCLRLLISAISAIFSTSTPSNLSCLFVQEDMPFSVLLHCHGLFKSLQDGTGLGSNN